MDKNAITKKPAGRSIRLGLASAIMLAAAAGAPLAQENLAFTKFEAFRYDSLIDGDTSGSAPCCAPHVIQVPGHALIHVSAIVDMPWSEAFTRISIGQRDITLTVDDGEPGLSIGKFDIVGRFELATSGLSANRPYDWPEEDRDLHVELVFAVPAEAQSATLTLGEHAGQAFKIPQAAVAPPAMIDTATIEVVNVAVLDRLETETGREEPKIPGAVIPASGAIVEVEMAFTPTASNALDGDDDYFFYTSDIQLADPGGTQVVLLGQILVDSLNNHTSNSFSGNNILGNPVTKTWYFLTDGTPGTYTLYYGANAAAQIEVP